MRATPSSSPAVVSVRLLDELLRSPAPLTLQAMAMRMQGSLDEVRRELGRLQAAGCELAEHPQQGVRLVRSGLGAWVDYLQFVLGGDRRIICYQRTSSTQDAARRLMHQGDGGVVVADEQTAGRGRLGRSWHAPPGACVMFSRVVRGQENLERLTFSVSVAIARTVQAVLGDRATTSIKWPNDVQVDGRKMAGILVEVGDGGAAVGVGINSHLLPADVPPELTGKLTSLAMVGVRVDRLLILAEALRQIDRVLKEPQAALLAEWRQHSTMLHHRAVLRHGGAEITGEVIDLDPDAGLIVRRDSGEIVHLPAATTTVVQ